MRILIADDERAIVDGIVAIVKSINWYMIDIVTSNDGADANEKMKSYKPDMAILDISMPLMTGLEVAENAHKWNLCNRCFILTGFSDFEYAQKAIRVHVKDYMLKPVKKKYLVKKIEEIAEEINEKKLNPNLENYYDIDFFNFKLCNSGSSQLVNDVIEYINNYYKEDISLTVISEVMSKHPNYISMLFSKETNTSFMKYLQFIRLKHAIHYLVHNPEITVKDISYMVGYTNPREFLKVFKKKTAFTPTQFREKYSHN